MSVSDFPLSPPLQTRNLGFRLHYGRGFAPTPKGFLSPGVSGLRPTPTLNFDIIESTISIMSKLAALALVLTEHCPIVQLG